MSFSFEFVAKQEDAVKIVDQEHAPEYVKAFLQQGLTAFKAEDFVHVKAIGHLYNKDYNVSACDMFVKQLPLRKPR